MRLTSDPKTVIGDLVTEHLSFGPVVVEPFLLMTISNTDYAYKYLLNKLSSHVNVKTLCQYDIPLDKTMQLLRVVLTDKNDIAVKFRL